MFGIGGGNRSSHEIVKRCSKTQENVNLKPFHIRVPPTPLHRCVVLLPNEMNYPRRLLPLNLVPFNYRRRRQGQQQRATTAEIGDGEYKRWSRVWKMS